jgi:carbon storage regulator
MLVLSRKVGEEIVLPHCGVTVGVVAVKGKQVRLGIAASPEVLVHRGEVWQRICQSREGSDWQQEVQRKIAVRTRGHLFDIEVEAIDGRLIVHGRSYSYYGKQLACAAALELMDAVVSDRFGQVELDIKVGKNE